MAARLGRLGISVTRSKDGSTIFIPLPPDQWRLAGGDGQCSCPVCKRDGTLAFWDCVAVGSAPSKKDYTWTPHYPELHPVAVRKKKTEEALALQAMLEEV